MGRNTTGGNKQKRGKNSTQESKKRPLTYADNKDTLYALVISPLGDCGFLVHCNDNVERIGIIRGAMYKSSFIQSGDMTLVSLREFEQVKLGRKERCDVLLKYHAEEVSQLVKRGLYYKDSTRPFLTKLEKGKSTKFDHQNPAGHQAGPDDDIITMGTAPADPPPPKKRLLTAAAAPKKNKDSGDGDGEEEDDSEFLLAKEDLSDFYGAQEEEEKEKEKKLPAASDSSGSGSDKENDEEDEEDEEEKEEELDCFGNRKI